MPTLIEFIAISLLTVVAVVIAVWAVKGDPTKYDEKRFWYDD
jgi:hypothetical protein